MRNWKQLTANSSIYVKIKSSFQYKSNLWGEKGVDCLPACLEGEKRNLSTIFYERVERFLLVFLFLIKMYEKEKAVKSKIVKSLTATRENKTMTTAPAAPHGGVATKHRRQPYWKVAVSVEDGDREELGDGDRVGNGGKMELPQGSTGLGHMENHKHK